MVRVFDLGEDPAMKREVPRQFTAWRCKYVLEGTPSRGWNDCQVMDISTTGAGLILAGTTPNEAVRRQLFLNITLRGEVKNVTMVDEGLRAGVEFMNIDPDEKAELRAMAALGVRW